MSLIFTPAHQLADRIRQKDISARELLETFLARIEAVNGTINAVIFSDPDAARAKADQIDADIATGKKLGPLAGLPMTIKDAFEVKNMTCEVGVPAYEGRRSSENAVIVDRLEAAGAIIIGKTNTPYLCADWQSYNRIHGTTNNPWNLEHTPGGSSGGSAAALATGMTPIEYGSDIGGSIRAPAHFCGLFGHKPSFGLVPSRGHVPPAHGARTESDLSVVGPLARNVKDLSRLLNTTMGPMAPMNAAYQLALQGPRAQSAADLRFGIWATDPFCRVSREIEQGIAQAAQSLIDQGARQVDIKPPFDLADHHEVYGFLLDAIMASNAQNADTSRYSYAAWLKMNERKAAFAANWMPLFEEIDVLLCPITPRTAPPHTQDPNFHARTMMVDGQERSYGDQLVWAGVATLCDLPATAVPLGLASDGLPFGMQIIAPAFEDTTALAVAAMLETAGYGVTPPPNFSA